jgi:hypothetical protein
MSDAASPRAANDSAANAVKAPSLVPEMSRAQLVQRVLQAVWMSIVLGLLMQLVAVAVQFSFNKPPDTVKLIHESVQKVSWSFIVCTGITIGNLFSKLRGPAMGLLGFVSAPAGFLAAKFAQKTTAQALSANLPNQPDNLVWALMGTKALEYALLGFALWYLGTKAWATWRSYALTGLTLGLVTGAVIVAEIYSLSSTSPPMLLAASVALNELLFPMGCAMVNFLSGWLARVLPSSQPENPNSTDADS